MKRFKLSLVAVLVIALFVSLGCVQATRHSIASSHVRPSSFAPRRATTYALAVSVRGGLQPTPAQWAALQAKFARDLAAAGDILVTDVTLADMIIRVDFTPNEDDPENSGRAAIVSILPNKLRGTSSASSLAYTAGGRYPTAFGFGAGFLDSYYSMWNSSYYGYGNSYYDGYSYGSVTLNPRKPVTPPGPTHPGHPGGHPHRHRPIEPGRCPPLLAIVPPASIGPDPVAYPGRRASNSGTVSWSSAERAHAIANRADRTDATYARSGAGSTSAPQAPRSTTWLGRLLGTSDSTRTNSDGSRTYSRGDRGYSRNDSSYSSSGYSPPPSSYSSSSSTYSPPPASYSAPSYSPPPASYSAPSYSPPPAASSAPSYSPPPSEASSSSSSSATSTSSNTHER